MIVLGQERDRIAGDGRVAGANVTQRPKRPPGPRPAARSAPASQTSAKSPARVPVRRSCIHGLTTRSRSRISEGSGCRGTCNDQMMTEIVTDRLILKPFRSEHLLAFVAYRSDPDVARYQSWDSAFSMTDAERFLESQRNVRFGDIGEWLQLAIVDRASGDVCGDCAVKFVPDQPSTAEIGVTVAVNRQGSGLATEALAALIATLFEQHRVIACSP